VEVVGEMRERTAVKRVVYARGFPYGAPLVVLRGGALRDPEAKAIVREAGFRWDGARHGYVSYSYDPTGVLRALRDAGYEVVPKADMDPGYVLDLDG
jgi:hypothetical protein